MHAFHHATISVVLNNYWHEIIDQKEARRRLEGRTHLTREVVEKTLNNFQQPLDHYLFFGKRSFKEYITTDDGITHLALLLRTDWLSEHDVNVVVPMAGEEQIEGVRRKAYGISFARFDVTGPRLRIEGREIEQLTYYEGSRMLQVDTAMLHPTGDEEPVVQLPARIECCLACEIVHSILSVHWADWICCLGCC